jgi:hypothetical protein
MTEHIEHKNLEHVILSILFDPGKIDAAMIFRLLRRCRGVQEITVYAMAQRSDIIKSTKIRKDKIEVPKQQLWNEIMGLKTTSKKIKKAKP